MSLLASLLPGLRDFRTPLAVGLLWLTSVGLLVVAHPAIIDGGNFENMAHLAAYVPQPYIAGAATFLAYVVGLVSVQITTMVAERLRSERLLEGTRKVVTAGAMLERIHNGLSEFLLSFSEILYPHDSEADRLADGIISRTIQNAGAPQLSAFLPKNLIYGGREMAALRLSKESPDQFQHYDRVRAEAEFRTAVPLPLVVAGCMLAWAVDSLPWAIVIASAAIVSGLALRMQGYRQLNESETLLMTAITLNWTGVPVLEDISYELGQTPDGDHGAQYAVVINRVIQSITMTELDAYLSGLRHPSRGAFLSEVDIPLTAATLHRLRIAGHMETIGQDGALSSGWREA